MKLLTTSAIASALALTAAKLPAGTNDMGDWLCKMMGICA